MEAYYEHGNGLRTKIGLYLSLEDIENLIELKRILRKCDCRYAETMDTFALPLIDTILEKIPV